MRLKYQPRQSKHQKLSSKTREVCRETGGGEDSFFFINLRKTSDKKFEQERQNHHDMNFRCTVLFICILNLLI